MGEKIEYHDLEWECMLAARDIKEIYEDFLEIKASKMWQIGRRIYQVHEKFPEEKITNICKLILRHFRYKDELSVHTLRNYYIFYKYWKGYREYIIKVFAVAKTINSGDLHDVRQISEEEEKILNEMDEDEKERLKREYEDYIKPHLKYTTFALGRDLPFRHAWLYAMYNVPYRDIPALVEDYIDNMYDAKGLKNILSKKYRRRPPPNPICCEYCLEELNYDEKNIEWIYTAAHTYCLSECRRARLEGRCPIFKTAIDPIEE